MHRIKELQKECDSLKDQLNNKDSLITKLSKALEQQDHKYLQTFEDDLKDVLPKQEVIKVEAKDTILTNLDLKPSADTVATRINKDLKVNQNQIQNLCKHPNEQK